MGRQQRAALFSRDLVAMFVSSFLTAAGGLFTGMTAERARGRELAQLVAHHFLSLIHI